MPDNFSMTSINTFVPKHQQQSKQSVQFKNCTNLAEVTDNTMHSNSNHLHSYLLLSTLGHLIPAPMDLSLSPQPVYMLHNLIFIS